MAVPLGKTMFVAAALLLAGCGEPVPAPATPPQAVVIAPVTSIPWAVTDCMLVVWFASVPAESLGQRVPPGFEVVVEDTGLARLGFEVFECFSGTGFSESLDPMQYGSLFIGVDAPDEYGCDGLPGGCYVKTEVLVPDKARREWLAGAGVSARNGSASISLDAAGTYTTSLVMDEVGGFGMQGIPRPLEPEAGTDEPFMEFMQARDGISWHGGLERRSRHLGGQRVWPRRPSHIRDGNLVVREWNHQHSGIATQ